MRVKTGSASRKARHLDAAFNLARWIVQSRGDAEDVTQEALPRALRSIPAPEANHTGKLGHRANYDRERLAYALEELPAPFREILVLRELEGCSYKEIAAITARPIGTVMSGLARTRQQLRTAHTRPAQRRFTMACEMSNTHLHAYLDGELDAAGMAGFERHLKTCAECVASLAAEESLRRSLQQAELYEGAPESIRQKLQAASSTSLPRNSVYPGAWRWLAVAAALIFATLSGWRMFSPPINPLQQAAWTTTLLDAHLRSLQPGHLTDVESTDQHTVKPWFEGKLDIAPPVHDFSGDGFPLLGGRLDVMEGRTVAALVYKRQKHIVNLFVWKSQDSVPFSDSGGRQGYHWVAWKKDELMFCAVSDTTLGDLQQLKSLFLQD